MTPRWWPNHPRAVLPDRECGEGRRAHHCPSRVRAGTLARQTRLYRSAALASEVAAFPRFRDAAVEGAGLGERAVVRVTQFSELRWTDALPLVAQRRCAVIGDGLGWLS